MFIDSHCHLDLFSLEKINEIIRECRKNNVKAIIANGINPSTNRKVLSLSENFNEIKAALGIYPIEALKLTENEIDKEIKFIETNKNKIVSIGEVGIDLKESEELEKQIKILEKFIALSEKINKALTIHSRKAEEQCINVLEKNKAKKVLMHHFSGKLKLLERILKNGWFISIPSSVVYSEHFQEVVKRVPLESLLCETDSPFLHPLKEKENTPANVISSYKKIAEIKNISLKEVENQIEENYSKLFN